MISFASAAFVYVRSYLTALLGLKASTAFFSSFTKAIFNAPMLFFDSTPVGRILTRANIFFSLVQASSDLITWQVLIVAVPAMVASICVQLCCLFYYLRDMYPQ
ncbi:hypothetical protein TSUD_356470, partial [Trifolium subterraneum]